MTGLKRTGTTIRSNAIFDRQIGNRHIPIDVEDSAAVVPAERQGAGAGSLDGQIKINGKLTAGQNDCWPGNSEIDRVTGACCGDSRPKRART